VISEKQTVHTTEKNIAKCWQDFT